MTWAFLHPQIRQQCFTCATCPPSSFLPPRPDICSSGLPTHAPFVPLLRLPFCPPPPLAGPHSSLYPSSHSSSLSSCSVSYPVFETLEGIVLSKPVLIHAMHCWEVTARFAPFPQPQCFVFPFPLHIICLIYVFICPAIFWRWISAIINIAD